MGWISSRQVYQLHRLTFLTTSPIKLHESTIRLVRFLFQSAARDTFPKEVWLPSTDLRGRLSRDSMTGLPADVLWLWPLGIPLLICSLSLFQKQFSLDLVLEPLLLLIRCSASPGPTQLRCQACSLCQPLAYAWRFSKPRIGCLLSHYYFIVGIL